MIRIIDRTLTTMDDSISALQSGDKLLEFCSMLIMTGVSVIEVSVPAFEKMGRNLPKGPKYILHLNALSSPEDYLEFDSFSSRHSEINNGRNIINEFQVNDIREINLLRQYSSLASVRIMGLDDIMCHDYASIFETMRATFNGNIDLCPENKYHCATAIAVEWVLSGGKNVSCSFAGAGGYAALEEILLALRISIRHKPNLDLSIFVQLKQLYEEITGVVIATNKPILGDKIFMVEAGIHVDGLLKNPITYEPYDPKIVGAKRTIVVGKYSGTKAVKQKLLEFEITVTDNEMSCIIEKIQDKSMKCGRSLTDIELKNMAREVKAN